jgi:ketosteroid isomerase-like protein
MATSALDVATLAAREAIRDLVVAYAHAADRGRFDDLVALFTPDGTIEMDDGRTFTGSDAIREFLTGSAASLGEATGGRYVRHHVSSQRVLVESKEQARSFAYFMVVTERGPDHWGRYHDTCVRTADGWRVARRRIRVEGWTPGSWAGRRHG